MAQPFHMLKKKKFTSSLKKPNDKVKLKKNTLINPHGSGRLSATNVTDTNTTRVSVLQYDEINF